MAVLVSIWWYLVSRGGTGWYLVVLGQYGAVLVGLWWYSVSMGRYLLIHGCSGSVNLVLIGIKWYLVSKVLLCLYIVKKWRFGRVLPMRDRLADRQQNIGLCYVSIFFTPSLNNFPLQT